MSEIYHKQIQNKVKELIGKMYKLTDDRIASLDPEKNLFQEIGIDSLEAFDAVVTLHEVLGVEIPRDIDPSTISNLGQLSNYLGTTYTPDVVQKLLDLNVEELLAQRASNDDSL